jgi:hypothetical protein
MRAAPGSIRVLFAGAACTQSYAAAVRRETRATLHNLIVRTGHRLDAIEQRLASLEGAIFVVREARGESWGHRRERTVTGVR